MKINDIVSFSKESFFNGAVQTEWFYDNKKVGNIAESYVFHGPKYYGVSNADVTTGEHRLLDTASFAKNIADKLYSQKPSNSFVMTIAGYGTGKSHLAVCLGALFSGENELSKKVIQNISTADTEIGQYIDSIHQKQNLVIVLNGMNNFNLDAEVLRCTRLALARHGISDEVLKKLTKSYDIARHFIENMFDLFQEKFNISADKNGLSVHDIALKNYLLSHIETDNNVLRIVNRVYSEINGDNIAWDRGLSAGDILLTLSEELCGEGKPYNKILLLFDEFGRYIEYTAANPIVAGEAALQQIFEAIQSADGKIIFSGFIQNELEAYLKRIEKTATITRYIERYRTACENLFLSSNFETILANILKKKPKFELMVGSAIRMFEHYQSKIQSDLVRWDRTAFKKGVWLQSDLYKKVILEGCYPLHPITVWLLSGSHQWMQQRSTLAFASEMFDQIAMTEMDPNRPPYVYPIQIIDSGIFNEMLNSEEKGLVSSQYCMLYRDILVKVGDKLSDLEKSILKAVLIVNIGRMAFRDRADAISAIRYCSNKTDDEVKHALRSLEEMHGVVAFDEHNKSYDLIAEANGYNEFKRIYNRYRLGVKASIDDLDEETLSQISINVPVETSFGADYHIWTTEWGFNKRIVDSSNITEEFLRQTITASVANCDGEKLRGMLIYAYCHENIDSEINRISAIHMKLRVDEHAVIILFLDDSEGEILSALAVRKALQKFSSADRDRFKKHIQDQQRIQNNKIVRTFTNCVAKRYVVGNKGLELYSGRINTLCTEKFSKLYTKAIPFLFDGFQNKVKTQARTTLISIAVGLLNQTLMNPMVYSSFTPKDKNRVSAVMSTNAPHSWKVFDDDCKLVLPGHPIVSEVIEEVEQALESGKKLHYTELFSKYLLPPYGLNDYSLTLLISYFIAYHGNQYIYTIGSEKTQEKLCEKHWTDSKGKLQLPEVKRIWIEKNINADVDLVGDLCKEILNVTMVEDCIILKQKLDALIESEGESEENKFLVSQAQNHLTIGIKLNNDIYGKRSTIQSLITELQQKFSIIKAVKALESIPCITQTIEEGYPFVYSEEYSSSIQQLKVRLRKLIFDLCPNAIQRLKCEITQLSQYKGNYEKTAKKLREFDFGLLATAIEDKIEELEIELIAKQRYESSIVECEKDLAFSTAVTRYFECEEAKKKLQRWISFFEDAKDLPSSISFSIKTKLNAAITSIQTKENSIIREYHSLISSVTQAESVSSLKLVDNKLQQILQQQFPEDWNRNIVIVREAISSAIILIEAMPQDIDYLSQVINNTNKDNYQYCWFAIKSCAHKLKEKLLREETSWINKYIETAEEKVFNMNPYECTSWLEKTSRLPSYLRQSSKIRYDQIRAQVETRLHAARVDGLLSMYDSLTDGEKEEFKRLLLQKDNAIDFSKSSSSISDDEILFDIDMNEDQFSMIDEDEINESFANSEDEFDDICDDEDFVDYDDEE